MKKFTWVCSLVFIALLLTTCQEEEATSRSYPRVRTGSVSNISSSGATFSGNIIFTSVEILDHGFVWATQSSPNVNTSEKISLGARSQKGEFTAEISRNLTEGITYYVRAYARSEKHLVYGEEVTFISLGSKAPELTSSKPDSGTWGDTVLIVGKNFSGLRTGNQVKFDAFTATVIKNSPDSIYCVVPDELAKKISHVSVTLSGNTGQLENAFSLLSPIVQSISPLSGSTTTAVTITGKYFSSDHSKVFFENTEALVTHATSTQITCKVPTGLTAGANKVTIRTGEGDLIAETSFELVKAVITGISPLTGTYNDLLTITGQSFNSNPVSNIVKFGNVQAQIVSMTATEIKVTVPVDLPVPVSQISLTYDQDNVVFPTPFTLLPPEITSVTPSDLTFNSMITISGKYFSPSSNTVNLGDALAYPWEQNTNQITVYPPADEIFSHELDVKVTASGQSGIKTAAIYSEWAMRSPFTHLNESHSLESVLINDKLYFTAVDPEGGSGKLYLFNENTNTWITKAAIPHILSGSFKFSIGEKCYVGSGEGSTALWEYNATSNQWFVKNDLPFYCQYAVGFSLNNKGYLMGRSPNFFYRQFWEYDPVSDSWTRKNNFPDFGEPYSGFMDHGEYYCMTSGNYLVKYDASDDSWSIVEDFNSYFGNSHSGFLFALNGHLYFGGVYETYIDIYDFQTRQMTRKENWFPYPWVAFTMFASSSRGYMIVDETRFWEFLPKP